MLKQKGFTMVELMMVVAIISILVLVALPAYQNYTIRTRVSEGLTLVTGAKTAVVETFQARNSVANQAATGFVSPAATPNVSDISISNTGNGAITVTFTATAGNGTIVFTPTLVTGSPVIWDCTGGTLAATYRPSICR